MPDPGVRPADEPAVGVDDALRLALKLAVEARDYERAVVLLELVKTTGSEPTIDGVPVVTRPPGSRGAGSPTTVLAPRRTL